MLAPYHSQHRNRRPIDVLWEGYETQTGERVRWVSMYSGNLVYLLDVKNGDMVYTPKRVGVAGKSSSSGVLYFFRLARFPIT